jgi:hypothetical protein
MGNGPFLPHGALLEEGTKDRTTTRTSSRYGNLFDLQSISYYDLSITWLTHQCQYFCQSVEVFQKH